MNYEDYKEEWEDFFTSPMRYSLNSASMDLARLSDDDAEDLANYLVGKVIEKFAHEMSSGRYFKYFVFSDWAVAFVRKDLFEKSVALINRSREEDKNNE